MADRDASARPVRRTRRRVVLGVGVALLVVAALVAGVLVGRATAAGPSLVVVSGPVVEESSSADELSVSGQVSDAASANFTPAPDLADTATTASGSRLSRSGIDVADVAQRLAAVFGIDGTIVRTSDGWTAGGRTDVTLTVRDDAMLSWAFADAAAQDAAQGGVFVSTARARAVTTGLLASIGVDPDSVDWRVDRFDTSLAIAATELLNDERTSLEWQVSFGQKDAVVSASGFAAELIEVPNYSVVGAATAVRRAALPTWSLIGPTPSAPTSPALGAEDAAGSSDEASLRVDVSSIVITDAELDLAEFHQPDGAVLILPAYHLTGDDGTRWTLIAVTGDYVNFVDVPFPGQASQTP